MVKKAMLLPASCMPVTYAIISIMELDVLYTSQLLDS